ncbi:MAG: fibrobacter succinogenes major paralogous domain-containing protein, partial [Dysgonamonadaceae bacterium]|nr:fibrobacter succinogenes major paralogous domain-containing protein [Dysgonamonadaceae bacterium]
GVPSTDWTSDNSESTLSFYNYENNNGYALYTSDTWSSITDKDSLIDSDDPEPVMFLPAAGGRNYYDGRVYDTGNNGRYWSSTVFNYIYVHNHYGWHMQFGRSNVYAADYSNRASGLSVRCISE